MRQIIADFSRLEEREEIGLSILLGSENSRPELRELQENEEVLFIEPENIQAVGIARSQTRAQQRYWFGVITGPIEDAPALSA